MDSVSYLNIYRTSVLGDEPALAILAVLYRDGTASERRLAEATNLHVPEVRRVILRLFHSRLVEPMEEERYKISLFATEVLKAFQIPEVAALWFLTNSSILERDRVFLQACISAREYAGYDTEITHQVAVSLRTLSRLETALAKGQMTSSEAMARTRYALIVGADFGCRALGPIALCEAIEGWLENAHDASLRDINRHRHFYAASCRRAFDDLDNSDNWLFARRRHDTPESEEVAAITALVRVLTTLNGEAADKQLLAAMTWNLENVTLIWDTLRRWQPNVISVAWDLSDLSINKAVDDEGQRQEILTAALRRLASAPHAMTPVLLRVLGSSPVMNRQSPETGWLSRLRGGLSSWLKRFWVRWSGLRLEADVRPRPREGPGDSDASIDGDGAATADTASKGRTGPSKP